MSKEFAVHVTQDKNYYSFQDQYSMQTFAGFAHNAEEAEQLYDWAWSEIQKLRKDIFAHYDVFLAGQRVGRR